MMSDRGLARSSRFLHCDTFIGNLEPSYQGNQQLWLTAVIRMVQIGHDPAQFGVKTAIHVSLFRQLQEMIVKTGVRPGPQPALDRTNLSGR